jgi:uncharacterized membrane protein
MLPWETVVWAKAEDDRSNAKTATSANTPKRVLRRGELRFNIVDLAFGIFITIVVLSELVLAAN